MGHTQAMGFAEMGVDLDVALSWHLSANHYPPLPHELISVAKEAIEKANDGDWDAEIDMPENIEFRGSDKVSVALAVETMHLDAWITGEEF